MKFDCGETWEEKEARLSNWHRWYAWRPVKVADHDCRWFEYVERKGQYISVWTEGWWRWKYREPSTHPGESGEFNQ